MQFILPVDSYNRFNVPTVITHYKLWSLWHFYGKYKHENAPHQIL